MTFTSIQKIRFDAVDGAGIVYSPKFFHFFHAAFEDFFASAAPLSYPELITDRRKGFPTVAISSTFTAPLAYGDIAVINLGVQAVGNTSLGLQYRINRQRDAQLSFSADITTVFIDLDTKKKETIPDDLRQIFDRLLRPCGVPAAGLRLPRPMRRRAYGARDHSFWREVWAPASSGVGLCFDEVALGGGKEQ